MADEFHHQPFHESIVKLLQGCKTSVELDVLGSVIVATAIPKNHREIRHAWVEARLRLGSPALLCNGIDGDDVEDSLALQEEAGAVKTATPSR